MNDAGPKPDLNSVTVGLNAVLATVDDDTPKVLSIKGHDGTPAIPYGAFDPVEHRTFEIGVRNWVERQTSLKLGYIEQLYTFGDKGREAPAALLTNDPSTTRIISVGYLALARSPAEDRAQNSEWRTWYEFFPWEDWRASEPTLIGETILPALDDWAGRGETPTLRAERIALAFGRTSLGWEEERALDRYELMYEAGLVHEAWRDRRAAGLKLPSADQSLSDVTGTTMASDHRRILATAIGRLRGKLKYRAVIFQLMADQFTLLDLQKAVEAIVGFSLHKQNFRRSVEQSGLVTKTGASVQQSSGRPAALFKVSDAARLDRAMKGLTIPRVKRSPSAKQS
ncbi:MAG: NAD regulator [Pseudomonadota bacterium]